MRNSEIVATGSVERLPDHRPFTDWASRGEIPDEGPYQGDRIRKCSNPLGPTAPHYNLVERPVYEDALEDV
jgi:hypothetical protein